MHRISWPALAMAAGLGLAAAAQAAERTMADAGCPQRLSKWAAPSVTDHYGSYYVGGGSALFKKAEGRYPHEGTFGTDYTGWHLHPRVRLQWSHGSRYQGGTGAYKTDGPHVPPPPILKKL